jgi:protein-tyrosine phosphatase
VCEILPWLELGGEKEVENQMHLMMRQVTHILNVTPDLPNKFPQQFVYLRVAVSDSERDRIDSHFDSVLSFFSRVEQKRGKLIAHCDSGSCRAPAFVIAHLMKAKGISLADAYDYVCARRPTTSLNQGFLQQLAKLELSLGNGCSVLYHADWQFFEFNNMKSDIDPKTDWRRPDGVLETALALHRRENDHDDHF